MLEAPPWRRTDRPSSPLCDAGAEAGVGFESPVPFGAWVAVENLRRLDSLGETSQNSVVPVLLERPEDNSTGPEGTCPRSGSKDSWREDRAGDGSSQGRWVAD